MALFTKNWKGRGRIAQEDLIRSTQPETADSVRIVTPAAFKKRFTIAERHAVRSSTDAYIQDIWDDLISRIYINMDDPEVPQGLGYVVNYLSTIPNFQDTTIMTIVNPTTRIDEVLIDATDVEIYRGIL